MSLLHRKVLPRPGRPTRMMMSFCRSTRCLRRMVAGRLATWASVPSTMLCSLCSLSSSSLSLAGRMASRKNTLELCSYVSMPGTSRSFDLCTHQYGHLCQAGVGGSPECTSCPFFAGTHIPGCPWAVVVRATRSVARLAFGYPASPELPHTSLACPRDCFHRRRLNSSALFLACLRFLPDLGSPGVRQGD